MRKLIVLLAAAGLLLGFAGSAQAGEFDPPNSTLGLAIGGLAPIVISALPGTSSLVTLANGSIIAPFTGHTITAAATIWSTVNFGPGTSLFTGVPLISNLKVTGRNQAVMLPTGFLADGFSVASNVIGGGGTVGPGFGGVMRLDGQLVIHAAMGAVKLPVPLSIFGGPIGETTRVSLIGINITVTAAPFHTAPWVITGITTNIISIPGRPGPPTGPGGGLSGVAFTLQPDPLTETVMTPSTNGGFVPLNGGNAFETNTVTITGTNTLASGASTQAGMVTVIAPLRIDTGVIAGRIPGAVVAKFVFVPEPGTVLLLVSGAVGLAVIGRRRMRK